MNEQQETPDVPPIPQPFAPRGPFVDPSAGGCGTPLLLGCSLLVLAMLIGAGFVVKNSEGLVAWAFNQSRQAIADKLPADLPAADRQEFTESYDAAVDAVTSQKLAGEGLRRLQTELQATVSKAGREPLTVEDVRHLSGELRKLVAEANGVEPVGGVSGSGPEGDSTEPDVELGSELGSELESEPEVERNLSSDEPRPVPEPTSDSADPHAEGEPPADSDSPVGPSLNPPAVPVGS